MAAATLYDNTGGALLTADGPILGTAEPALRIPAGDYLTTEDLTVGDSGDAGNLPAFSIETWFRTPTIGAQQIIAQGPNAHAPVPNRQWTLYLLATGALKFDFVDSTNANHSLSGTLILSTNTWYHIVAVYGANTQRIYINGVQNTSAASGGTPWPDLIAGTSDMRLSASGNTYALDYAEFAFYRYAIAADRVLAHYQAGSQRGFAAKITDVRIRDVLSAIGSRIASSLVGLGQDIIPRYMTGQAPLGLIREALAVEAVDTAFFVTAGGTFLGLGSGHRSVSPYNSVQAIFGDGGGSELPYLELELDYSDSFIANEWNVTREGGSQDPGQTQTVSDATSISRYGYRPQSISGLPVAADTTAATRATALLAKYKDPMQRITAITFNTVDPNVALALFQRELGDKITILRTPPGGGSRVQQDVWIQKIETSGTNDGSPISVRWAVSPL